MVAAGFRRVFMGIETPVPESLREAQKYQNTHGDLVEMVRTVQRSGMEVMGGFIVGFDNDPQDIFQLQYDFIQKTGIAAAMVGLLTALPKTQLYHRLLGEGRLDTVTTGNNTEAVLNFMPKLDKEFLISGYKRLMWTLYEPTTYYRRVLTFLGEYRPRGPKLRAHAERRAGVRPVAVDDGRPAPRPPGILEVPGHRPGPSPAQTAAGDRPGHSRLPLPHGGQAAVSGGERGRVVANRARRRLANSPGNAIGAQNSPWVFAHLCQKSACELRRARNCAFPGKWTDVQNSPLGFWPSVAEGSAACGGRAPRRSPRSVNDGTDGRISKERRRSGMLRGSSVARSGLHCHSYYWPRRDCAWAAFV